MTNVNNVVAKYSDLQGLDLVELNNRIGKGEVPSDVSTALRNNGGGHWNHTFFWKARACWLLGLVKALLKTRPTCGCEACWAVSPDARGRRGCACVLYWET